mmetsp:Transcript_84528/g.262481  ORF Transcript_84528/g.262481 Transcript_84528/m.262481 type:complete len:297 (-) Transcript_84528:54-944(-)
MAALGDAAQQVVLGSIAGVCADVVVHPLSTLKTRLQVQGAITEGQGVGSYRGLGHALWSTVRSEGPLALYRGLGAVLAGAVPGQCLHLAGGEAARTLLGSGQGAAGGCLAGACGSACASVIWAPLDAVRERLQVQGQVQPGGQRYSGSFRAFAHILQHEGAPGLYRALPVHLLTWVPFHACFSAVYEQGKAWCINVGYEDGHDNLEPTAQLCCTSAAAIVASVATNPLDVLRARVQVAPMSREAFPFRTAREAARRLLEREGATAFLDGAFARACWMTPRLLLCSAACEVLAKRLS